MPICRVQLARVVIGEVVLEPAALRQRKVTARFEPGEAFARLDALFAEYHRARLSAGRAELSVTERHRNHELVEETLGFQLLGPAGERLGKVVSLMDQSSPAEGERWEITVLLAAPSFRPPPSGNRTA